VGFLGNQEAHFMMFGIAGIDLLVVPGSTTFLIWAKLDGDVIIDESIETSKFIGKCTFHGFYGFFRYRIPCVWGKGHKMSQKYSIRDYNMTPNEIAEKLGSDQYRTGLDVRKKFEEVLEALNFSKEDTCFFKTTDTDKGQYIFLKEDGTDVIGTFKKLFEIDLDHITREERGFLIDSLISLSPICHSAKQVNAWEDTNEKNRKAEERKAKKREMVFESLSEYAKAKNRINEIVNAKYGRTRGIEVYKKLFSEDVQTFDEDLGHNYYLYLCAYSHIYKWRFKWSFIMEYVGRLRMADRYDFSLTERVHLDAVSDENWKEFYKSGKIENESLNDQIKTIYGQKKVMPPDIYEYVEKLFRTGHDNENKVKIENPGPNSKCQEECEKFVKEIIDAPLKEISEEDFFFTVGIAFDELEEIRKTILHEQKCHRYANMMKKLESGYDVAADDLKKIEKVREGLQSKHRSMVP